MTTRITGGSHRGRRLRSSGGVDLRPTSEMVRGAMFSIVGPDTVVGARVLDLYAGTGALGIEALSRDATLADFVEVRSSRCREIRENLAQMGLADRGRVHRARVDTALDSLQGGYGLVFIDPPYDSDPWAALMGRLGEGDLLVEDAIVVAEHRSNTELADSYGRLARTKLRRHGDTGISVFVLEGTVG